MKNIPLLVSTQFLAKSQQNLGRISAQTRNNLGKSRQNLGKISAQPQHNLSTGTPPLTRFFGPEKNRVKGKPCYRRSILVLKP